MTKTQAPLREGGNICTGETTIHRWSLGAAAPKCTPPSGIEQLQNTMKTPQKNPKNLNVQEPNTHNVMTKRFLLI